MPSRARRRLAARAAHEVVLHTPATGEDVGELLAEVAPAEPVTYRGERHRVAVVHRVERDRRRRLARHGEQDVDVAGARNHDGLA